MRSDGDWLIGTPFLVLVLVSLAAGTAGAYAISRDTPRTLVVFAVSWLVVGLLAFLVRENASLREVDSSVANWAYANASPLSLRATDAVTRLGDTLVVIGLAGLLVVVEWLRRRSVARVVLFFVTIMLGIGLLTVAAKLLMQRERPKLNPLADTLGFSFPSGHASLAAAFYAAVALLFSRGRGRNATAAIGGAAVAIAVAVAASRVFLDLHWLSDAVAGLAFGWGWFAFSVFAFRGGPRLVAKRAV